MFIQGWELISFLSYLRFSYFILIIIITFIWILVPIGFDIVNYILYYTIVSYIINIDFKVDINYK